MMIHTPQRLFILLCVILLVQCAVFRPGPMLTMEEQDADKLKRALLNNFQNIRTLNANGRILVQTPHKSFSGYAQVLIRKPDSIYVKLEAMLGLDIGVFFTDHRQFTLYSPMENMVYQSDHPDTLKLESFIGFQLSKSKFVQLLCGQNLPEFDAAQVTWHPDSILLNQKTACGMLTYKIDPYWGAVTEVSRRNSDGVLLQQEKYSQFIRRNGSRIPQIIRITRPRDHQSLTLVYQTVAVNEDIDPGKFQLKSPDSAVRYEL
ncbi:MAG: DUF4292 domain-containing protein [candidate division KSB1 bacterium]|nr:DUF4292 domain-containing protein [candidate division KSB1 bacterium]